MPANLVAEICKHRLLGSSIMLACHKYSLEEDTVGGYANFSHKETDWSTIGISSTIAKHFYSVCRKGKKIIKDDEVLCGLMIFLFILEPIPEKSDLVTTGELSI